MGRGFGRGRGGGAGSRQREAGARTQVPARGFVRRGEVLWG